jgi:hypothetical protein
MIDYDIDKILHLSLKNANMIIILKYIIKDVSLVEKVLKKVVEG